MICPPDYRLLTSQTASTILLTERRLNAGRVSWLKCGVAHGGYGSLVPIEYDPTSADSLNLDTLGNGFPGISPKYGGVLAKAAVVCLEEEDHESRVEMRVRGVSHHNVQLTWSVMHDREQAARCWGDPEVATEHGAYGIATLLVEHFTNYTVIQRSRKGTGFDFWLGEKGSSCLLFQNAARLEVSGIRRGTERLVRQRLRQKLTQIRRYGSRLPSLVTVVEFGGPQSWVRTDERD